MTTTKPSLTEAIWRAAPYFAAIAARLEREERERQNADAEEVAS